MTQAAPDRGLSHWKRFLTAFLSELRTSASLGPRDLWHPLRSRPERTDAFLEPRGILARVADTLKLGFAREYLNVDCHMKTSDGWPEIYIEVENNPLDTSQEIEKLCYVRSPLKVLITIAHRWPISKKGETLKQLWTRNISESFDWLPEDPSVAYGFVVLVLKANGSSTTLIAYTFAFNTKGDMLDEERREVLREFV